MNFRPAVFILFLFIFSNTTDAQVIGKIFPKMEAETAEDKEVVLPEATKGKFTLLGLAYSKRSEDDLNTWYSPVYNKFLRESTGIFSSFGYDVNVYFVPMFTGLKATATGAAKNKALKGLDPKLLPHILFYKGKLKEYKKTLDLEKKDVPYFFVLDKDGKIVYSTYGKCSGRRMAEIEAVLNE